VLQGLRPAGHDWHWLFRHAYVAEEHWLALVQLVRHAVEPQMYGLHGAVDTAGQVPEPSQLAGLVWVPLEQLAARQFVSAPGMVQVAFEALQ
jgi:hypothetical protein